MLQTIPIVQFIVNIVSGIIAMVDSVYLFSNVSVFDFLLGTWIVSSILGLVFVIARR